MNNGNNDEIWLEVSNIRISSRDFEVQIKGEKNEREPTWWKFSETLITPGKGGSDPTYRAIADGLEKKRPVFAKLACVKVEKSTANNGTTNNDAISPNHELRCTDYRVQFTDSIAR